MIPINVGFYYSLGAALSPLSRIEDGMTREDAMPILYTAENYLDVLLRDEEMPLRTALHSGNELLGAIREVKSDLSQVAAVSWYLAYRVTSGLQRFVTVLLAELQIRDAYYVSQKGGYDTSTLIERGENLLPAEVRGELAVESLQDFKQGCRCLAFELPTAAGFHFLRATEAVLHSYYDVMTGGRARPTFGATQQPAPMGTYITEAGQHGTCDPKVINSLRQLKDLHRNTLMHPEDVLTMNEALILLGMVMSVIMAMIGEMQKKRAASAAASTAIVTAPPSVSGSGTGSTP